MRSSSKKSDLSMSQSSRHHVVSDEDIFEINSSLSQPTLPKGLPGFICKLYKMASDSRLRHLICWSEKGNSFVISNPDIFSKEVLPLYCKHNNFSSFIRQLNMYGFHKIPNFEVNPSSVYRVTSGIGNTTDIATSTDIWEFENPNFIRNRPDLLINIKRKIGKTAVNINNNSCELDLQIERDLSLQQQSAIPAYLLEEISNIKRQQESIISTLATLKSENQHLWSESCVAQERYQQQQDTINKILQFLASIFSTSNSISIGKKNIPLPTSNPTTTTTTTTGSDTSEVQNSQLQSISNSFSQNVHLQNLVQKLQSDRCSQSKKEDLLINKATSPSDKYPILKEQSLYEDIDMLNDNIALLENDLSTFEWNPNCNNKLINNSDLMIDDSLPEGIEHLLQPSIVDNEQNGNELIDPSLLDFSQLLNSSPKRE